MTVKELRKQFPGLEREVYGKPLIYLDNAATSQRCLGAIEAQSDSAVHHNGNTHRSVYALAAEATRAYEGARERVAGFIGASSPEEIVFTSGTTSSINLVASSFGGKFIGPGDEIIVAESEHHSDIIPWQLLAERKGAKIVVLPVEDSGKLRVEALKGLINKQTKLVCVAQISNVLGLVNPLSEIISVAHSAGVPVLVDGAQGVVHQKVSVKDLDCDFYAFSGHKMYAATGIGVLYAKKSILEQMPPYMGGGEMIGDVSWEESTYADIPYKFEAGTPNINSVPTFVPAIDLLEDIWTSETALEISEIKKYVYEALSSDDRIVLRGTTEILEEKVPLFSFSVKGVHHEDLALILDKMGIAVRSGHMCAQPLMKRFGVTGMIRASFAPYNTLEEAKTFIKSLNKAIELLQ
ncbi:MAG: SufS family cysteine desulfurase [Bacteroidales bacterium]|nr:SufS family cysteine desulfurase [Bacteroidales bacterium]